MTTMYYFFLYSVVIKEGEFVLNQNNTTQQVQCKKIQVLLSPW